MELDGHCLREKTMDTKYTNCNQGIRKVHHEQDQTSPNELLLYNHEIAKDRRLREARFKKSTC